MVIAGIKANDIDLYHKIVHAHWLHQEMELLTKITFAMLLLQVVCDTDVDSQSKREVIESKKAVMESLGLQYAPRTIPSQSDFLLRRFSAPKFMMGLFKEVSSDVNLTDEHYQIERRILDESKADTVISFFNYDHDRSWNRIHEEFKIKFKTKFNPQDDVQGGELKIFKRLPRNKNITHANCSMSVFLILSDGGTKHIDKLNVNASESGWLTFNITAAIKLWALFPLSNHGLMVVVRHAHETLSPHYFGIVSTRGNLGKRPYLVGFVTTNRVLSPFTHEVSGSLRQRRAAKKYQPQGSSNACKLKKFYVDFRDVGLHNTIIAPKGYDMFFCKGTCSYPLESEKSTLHAELQSLLSIDPNSGVSDPCCVPGNLKSVNLLFFNNEGNIVLKNHPDMIATSCVCH